mmetsp:Transcript_43163/g.104484  ORF Transcript_43163/g.104484 Transcript_43163/m.104484 type:complete len:1087 (-) Transcript_43163:82-3342(-)
MATTASAVNGRRSGMKDGSSMGPAPVSGNSSIDQPATTSATTNNRKPRKKHNAVTPLYKQHQSIKTSLDHRMTVEKNIVDELLLVCGVIGTTTNEGDELVPVTDCLNWLQDLQRALRRDEDLYRPISLLLGKWKVVEQKLIPLVLTCRYDTSIVLTVVKIMVILTKPLSDNTKRAGKMIIDTSSQKADMAKAAQQIKLRENALEQADQLMEYKRLIAYHPSHHTGTNNKKKNNNNNNKKQQVNSSSGLLSIFVSLLAEPLSKAGAARSDADHLTIELVLHLIRNLLSAEPLLNSSSETHRQSQQLHQDIISLFDRELVLEILLVIGQEMELRENSQYNLLIMEILHHLLKSRDPTAVAKSINQQVSGDTTNTSMERQKKSDVGSSSSASSSFLLSKLKQEQAQRRNMTGVRHGNFASTWTKKGADGKEKPVTAAAVVGSSGQATSLAMQQTKQKRRNRAAEPFIGSGKALLAHTAAHSISDGGGVGPSTKRANLTLHSFCRRFVKDCYGPFMKSLKNEFRRDSHRLEETDKVVFFRLVWFFSQWWRVSRGQHKDKTVGRLIITMDVFTFNLVLNSTDTFEDRKQYSHLAQTVALYSEMMHLLHDMYTSGDTTEHEMAMGLLDRLFYHGHEALDRLPRLLSKWKVGINTREYVCDVAELCYMTLKLLDVNAKKGIEFMKSQDAQRSRKDQSAMKNKIAKMRSVAAEFDVNSYFVRKIVSSDVVIMCVHLLGQYRVNSPVVNHRIMAMFLRVTRLEIASPEIADEEMPINPLGSKRVTLEPMLYNLPMITVMEQILNDSVVRKEKTYESLVQFCTNLMYNFWSAADSNPLLYIECLFRHPVPHRFCESFSNTYVDEEMRMMALRDLLREEQERALDDDDEEGDAEMQDNQTSNNNTKDGYAGSDDDDDDENELEFTDDGVRAATDLEVSALQKRKRALSKRRKTLAKKKTAAAENSDSEDDDTSVSKESQPTINENEDKTEDTGVENSGERFTPKDDGNTSGQAEVTALDSAGDSTTPVNDEGDEAIPEPESQADDPQPQSKKPRLNRFDDEDSSDDELLNDMAAGKSSLTLNKPTRMAIFDDDDDNE